MTSRSKDCILCKGGDAVCWLAGHVLEMLKPDEISEKWKTWSLDNLPITPDEYPKRPVSSKKGLFTNVRDLCKDPRFDIIVNAGDPDREGQLLVDEVLDYIGNRKPVQRILVNATDTATVRKALNSIRPNTDFKRLTESGMCRERADFALGMTLSRALTVKLREAGGFTSGGISFGRVQTPTLALVVNRQREMDNFKPTPYWLLKALVKVAHGQFEVTWRPHDNTERDAEGHIIDEKAINMAIQRIGKGPNNGRIASVDKKPETEQPPRPFALTGFQKAMAKYGVKLKESLAIAQKLYDEGYTTYPRSAHDTLPASQLEDAPKVLAAIGKSPAGAAFAGALAKANPKLRSKVWLDKFEPEHHAIIPTGVPPKNLTKNELIGYMEIALRYVWQFLPPMEGERTTVLVESPLEASPEVFTATGLVVLKPGWKEFAVVEGLKASKQKSVKKGAEDEEDEDDEENGSNGLPQVTQGESADVAPKKLEKQTKPPRPFTQASLITAMEKIGLYVKDEKLKKLLMSKEVQGIGTAATRTAIIEGLLTRGLIEEKKNKLSPTDKGYSIIDSVVGTAAEKFMTPDTTGVWEMTLQEMSEGKGNVTLASFMDRMKKSLTDAVENLKTSRTVVSTEKLVLEVCTACGEKAARRVKGKFGWYWKCMKCGSNLRDDKGKPGMKSGESGATSRELPEAPCPICGKGTMKLLPLRAGGSKWHCENKKCDVWLDDVGGKPFSGASGTCPKCGRVILKKTSAKGTPYWLCTNRQKCGVAWFSDGVPDANTPHSEGATQSATRLGKKTVTPTKRAGQKTSTRR